MLFFLCFYYLINFSIQQQEICKTDVLSKYGFRGLQFAVNYEELVPYMAVNLCPNLTYSCCGQADFKYAREKWDENRQNFKEYIRGIFKTVQQITVLQSSLLIFQSSNLQYENEFCRKVDFTFFNNPSSHGDILDFLPDALRAFGFLQKGFYCMTCDASAQQYLSVKAPTQLFENIISEKFCSQMIFFFREYLIYKAFYLDTLYENVVKLGNCLHNKEVYHYLRPYQTNFHTLKECLYKGLDCHQVCKQFQIGQSGSLFLGELSEYINLLEIIKELLSIRKAPVDKSDEEHEQKLDKIYYEQLTSNFYGVQQQKESGYQDNIKTNVRSKGINLFEYAIMSNFYLEIFSKHDYSQNLSDYDHTDFNQNYVQKLKEKEKIHQKIQKKKQIKISEHVFKNISKEDSSESNESSEKDKSSQPELLNQVRHTHNQNDQVSNEEQNIQNSEILNKENLLEKQIDEKLRENSSYNIKQEVGSNLGNTKFVLKFTTLFSIFYLVSFN